MYMRDLIPLAYYLLPKLIPSSEASSGIGTELNFFVDLINFCVEYINAEDVITLLYRILSLDQSLFEICNLKEEK